MSRRLFAAVAFVALGLAPWSARVASAQERVEAGQSEITPVKIEAAKLDLTPVKVMQIGSLEFDQRSFPVPPAPRPTRSAVLGSLYASTAIVQALDVHSTIQALDRGAVEANPLMSGLTKNKAAFIATKAAVATSMVFAARSMAKRNKVAAIVTLVALNSAYAMVVQHNYAVARKLR